MGTAASAAHSARRGSHSWNEPAADISTARPSSDPPAEQERCERFHALYRENFDFVYRNLRRLGIDAAAVDDALQEVFLVALWRLNGFQAGTHAKAWLFAIAIRVAGNHRRAKRRRAATATFAPDLLPSTQLGPFDQLSRSEAARVVHGFLDSLDDDKRAVFVMVELEQMTAPEIAQALAVNVHTVYSRLRAARIAFEHAVGQRQYAHGCEAPVPSGVPRR